jgi:hypothetical protein
MFTGLRRLPGSLRGDVWIWALGLPVYYKFVNTFDMGVANGRQTRPIFPVLDVLKFARPTPGLSLEMTAFYLFHLSHRSG